MNLTQMCMKYPSDSNSSFPPQNDFEYLRNHISWKVWKSECPLVPHFDYLKVYFIASNLHTLHIFNSVNAYKYIILNFTCNLFCFRDLLRTNRNFGSMRVYKKHSVLWVPRHCKHLTFSYNVWYIHICLSDNYVRYRGIMDLRMW